MYICDYDNYDKCSYRCVFNPLRTWDIKEKDCDYLIKTFLKLHNFNEWLNMNTELEAEKNFTN